MICKRMIVCTMASLLVACQTTSDEVKEDLVGPKWPYAWYWEAKKKGNGTVSKSLEAITFSGLDFVTIRHRPVPLEEPLPSDVVALAEKYCWRLGKYAVLRDISPRYSSSAAFLCLTQEELDNFVPM